MEGIVCCRYSPGPDSELITVPIIPQAQQQDALCQAHDIPGSGHQSNEPMTEVCKSYGNV